MDWCWSWNSNTSATWCKELTRWKRPWCWEKMKAGGEGDDRGWDGWMASLTQWMWVWASSSSWWWTGKPGVLQSVGSQRVRHDWATELILILIEVLIFLKKRACSLIGWWLLPVTNRTGSKSIAHREPLHYLATKGPTPHGQFSGDSSFSGFLILVWYDIGSSKL